ncbi:hypothetical protein WJX81_006450 [Elliptochloris bilobata]|uniref:Uncharacterized protein n=1 Tax=Elliptochloris bilobata TaxID=381761 RepID=A0AAW1S6Y9_9CHLO
MAYDLEGPGRDGVVKYFRKPYRMVTLMFIGMPFCLPLSCLEQWQARRPAAAADPGDASKPLLESTMNISFIFAQILNVSGV